LGWGGRRSVNFDAGPFFLQKIQEGLVLVAEKLPLLLTLLLAPLLVAFLLCGGGAGGKQKSRSAEKNSQKPEEMRTAGPALQPPGVRHVSREK
jgi:hypothetical protein